MVGTRAYQIPSLAHGGTITAPRTYHPSGLCVCVNACILCHKTNAARLVKEAKCMSSENVKLRKRMTSEQEQWRAAERSRAKQDDRRRMEMEQKSDDLHALRHRCDTLVDVKIFPSSKGHTGRPECCRGPMSGAKPLGWFQPFRTSGPPWSLVLCCNLCPHAVLIQDTRAGGEVVERDNEATGGGGGCTTQPGDGAAKVSLDGAHPTPLF